MSTFNFITSTLTFETIQDWTVETVEAFLKFKQKDFSLSDAEIQKFVDCSFNGPALLNVNIDDLMSLVGLRVGPALNVSAFVENLNNQKSGQIEPLKTVEEIIKHVTKDSIRLGTPAFELPDKILMPLQQRNFEAALIKIKENVRANAENKEGKSNYWCLVSAGTPGIGKTRFGKELYEYLKRNWEQPQNWADVHFEYLRMDFGSGIYLDDYDRKLLTASEIFGLRIAYALFIEKYYDMTFKEFRSKVLTYGKYIFMIEPVITYYYESLKLYDNRKLFLYLHIDDFQLIDAWNAEFRKNIPSGLFKKMIRDLSQYMTHQWHTFIQPFLSGTAPQVIAAQKQASPISFYPVDCPLLENASMIRIMDHFATKFNAPTYPNRVYEWNFVPHSFIFC
ncbi:hypothetical protein C2G38_967273 [Gigaspora rosea]|uniref:SAM domain-containing protein n=1 Tax=Gigaspora rosea TaxID=44941 RepID=A0A397W876_9GLOM|nr:hypothetical protein C2G38_967273 [Gigaspora rosea]